MLLQLFSVLVGVCLATAKRVDVEVKKMVGEGVDKASEQANKVGDKLAEVSCTLWDKVFHTHQCGRIQEAVSHLTWLQVCDIFLLTALITRVVFRVVFAVKYVNKDGNRCCGCNCADSATQKGLCLFAMLSSAIGWYVVHYENVPWTQLPFKFNENVSWLGLGFAAVLLLASMWNQWSMSASYDRSRTEAQKDHKLRICGAYKYARHPMYLNLMMHPVAVLLITQNWFLALSYSSWVVYALSRVKNEEKLMVEIFGQDYIDYMLKVSAFGPVPMSCNKKYGLTVAEALKHQHSFTEARKEKDKETKKDE